MPPQPGETVIWIKVAKPTFDLVGVVLSAFGLTGILVALALVLGITLGLSLIMMRRSHQAPGGGLALNSPR